jgi:hypothetical protein
MATGNLLRLSGLAGILAGILIILAEVLAMAAGIMDMATMARTPLGAAWVPLNLLEILGVMLLLLAFFGIYCHQAGVAGGFGLLGFLVAFVGSVMFLGAGWMNAFSAPVVARSAPALLQGFPPPPLGQALVCSAWLFAIGLVLFGLTVISAGVLPKAGGWLLVIGGVLSRGMPIVNPRFNMYLPLDSWVTSIALILLGYALWSAPATTARIR